jgi:hydrogenase maturation protease
VRGRVDVRCEALPGELFRLAVAIENHAELDDPRDREAALLRTFVSTHTLLGVREGEFVSLLEPPEAARGAAAGCRNVGTWPVLVGKAGARDAMLSSPIILYDYPAIAEQSPGDLFDSTEIDEILSLRILTLTDEEKRQMREAHPRARALLERTEALTPEQLMALHGTLRSLAPRPDDGPPWGDGQPAKDARALSGGGVDLLPGGRVRLRPRPGGDVFDLLLAGKTATIGSIEQDYEGRVFLSLTVDDDPGQDLGAQGKPGHRFFFRPEEVEPLGPGEAEP